jgi:hypothetical protein
MMAFDADEKVRERETVIPEREGPAAPVDDPGIDEGSGDLEIDIDYPLRSSDLRGRNAPPESLPASEFREGVSKVACQGFGPREFGCRHSAAP